MRRGLVLVAAGLALAGCGSEPHGRSAPPPPPPPKLPHALAQSWARQADTVAAALAAGDGCAARAAAATLQHEVIAAVNARQVPRRLLEPLSSGVNELASRITCSPPPPPAAQQPENGNGHGKAKGREKHGKGEGD